MREKGREIGGERRGGREGGREKIMNIQVESMGETNCSK